MLCYLCNAVQFPCHTNTTLSPRVRFYTLQQSSPFPCLEERVLASHPSIISRCTAAGQRQPSVNISRQTTLLLFPLSSSLHPLHTLTQFWCSFCGIDVSPGNFVIAFRWRSDADARRQLLCMPQNFLCIFVDAPSSC